MQRKAKRKVKSLLYAILLVLLLFICFFHIESLSNGVRDGLSLCAKAIIPTLFPFLILSELLLSHTLIERVLFLFSRPFSFLFHIPPEGGIAFFMGNLFGFPMGAKTVAHYYRNGKLNKKCAERLLLFSGGASPFFLIGSVGLGMFGSVRTGIFLYLVQIFISLSCGLLLSQSSAKGTVFSNKVTAIGKKRASSFTAIIHSAVRQTLFICGYILFFSAIIAIILPCIKSTIAANVIAALLEIGSACSFSALYGGKYAIPFCAFATSFSGISVFCQTLDCIEDTDLKIRAYLPVKLLCGIAAFMSALILA